MEKKKIISDINSMLDDMNGRQVQNVYDYVCNEYDEEGHQENLIEQELNMCHDIAIMRIVIRALVKYIDIENIKDQTLLELLQEYKYIDKKIIISRRIV